MDALQQQEALKALYEERDELSQDLAAINRVIDRMLSRSGSVNSQLPQSVNEINNSGATKVLPLNGVANGSKDESFPKTANLESQIIYVFNRLKKAHRYPEFQNEFAKLSGSNRDIRKDLMDLRRKGVLAAVRYNNNFSLVYQGLPDWVTNSEVGLAFKEEFIDINSSKFLKGIWKSEKIEDEEKQEGHPEGQP